MLVGLGSLQLGEACGQLDARADPELRVDSREVRLDGLDAHEERASDLFVLRSGGRQLGYVKLGRRELSIERACETRAGEVALRALEP
jgi:hypothetical protein